MVGAWHRQGWQRKDSVLKRGMAMATLVLKKWAAETTPVDQDGNYIVISGRESGLLAWFLACVGIDPTTTMKVSQKRIEFKSSSLSGTSNRMLLPQGVSSTYYGYHKPWKKALGLFIVFLWLFGSLIGSLASSVGPRNLVLGIVFSVATSLFISLLYYFLNRTLMIGIVENSGLVNGIMFKRSVIENINIDERQARYVCELTQSIIETVQNKESILPTAPPVTFQTTRQKTLTPVTVNTPRSNYAKCPECGVMLDCAPDIHDEMVVCGACSKPFQVH